MHTQPIIRGGGSWNCAAPLPLFQGNIGFADCILLLTRHKANKSNFGLLRPLTWSEVDHWMPSPPWTTETSNLIRGWPLHALAPCTTETSNPIRGWPLHALAPCTTETCNPIRGWPLHALAPCTTDTSNLIWDWPLASPRPVHHLFQFALKSVQLFSKYTHSVHNLVTFETQQI